MEPRTKYLSLAAACLLGILLAGTPVAADAPAPLTATLLPTVGDAERSRLAVSWRGEPGVRLSVTHRPPDGREAVLLEGRPLDAGVQLLNVPLSHASKGELHLRAQSPVDAAEVTGWTQDLGALRGASEFAWEPGFFGPGVDAGASVGAGGVDAMAVWDDGDGPALYVGGGFVTAGPHQVTRIARWDGTEWSPLTGPNGTGVEMDGGGLPSVKALAVFEGDLIVAGFFDTAGGVSANNIAHWDGVAWSPLGPGLTGSIGIETLAVFDGALIAGGRFTQAGDQTVNRIARWDGSQWSALGDGVSEAEFNQTPRVDALAVYQGELVVGGNFLQAGDVPVQRIARWDGGTWAPLGAGVSDASNPDADLPSVRALTVFGDELIAGGNFTKAGGLTARLIARWDGSAWSPLGGGMDGAGNPNVSALTVYDGALIAGGNFTEADGATVNRVARWDGGAWSALSGPAGTGTNATVATMAVFDGELIVGSPGFGFSQAGGVIAHAIARWDGGAWATLSGLPGTGVSGQIHVMTLYDGALIVGGSFTYAGGEIVHNIARWDGTAWSPLSGPFGPGVLGLPGGGVTPSVHSLAVYQGHLFVGGSFLDAGGVFVRHIARWDGSEWSALGPDGSGVDNTAGTPVVTSLAVVEEALILGGQFNQAGGTGVSHIARWDGSAWSTLSTGLNDPVESLLVFDGALIAGGRFTQAGAVPANRIARWDGESWSALGAGLNGWAVALGEHDGALIAGGNFSQAGGQPASRIARWDGGAWSPLGAGVDGNVEAVAVYDGALIAGGRFAQAGGAMVNRIARWDGAAWSPLVGPAGVGVGGWSNPIVGALATFDADGAGPEPDKLLAGGRFHLAGGVAGWNLAPYGPAEPQGNLVVTPSSVTFGAVTVGDSAEPQSVTLASLGNVPVEVTAITAAAVPFQETDGSCPPTPFELAPAESCMLGYGFAPTEVGDFEQIITLETSTETAFITLAGVGVPLAPPAIQVDPDSFSVVLHEGETLEESLTIANTGGEVLEWALSPDCDLPDTVDWLDLTPTSGSVPGGAAESVTVSFDAGGLAIGDYPATPCIASNDPASPLVELPIVLTVAPDPPTIDVDPESLSATLEAGESESQALSIANLGDEVLEWTVTEDPDLPEDPEFGASVNTLTVWDDGNGPALYVAGARTGDFNGIARWDGEQWTALGTGFDNGTVYALTVYDGALIVGGSFSAAGGVTVNKVARWDGTTWSPLGSGMPGGITVRVSALTVFDGELIAGGSFTEAGGVTVNGIARWNGAQWAPLGDGLTTQVFALTVHDGALIAGGGFAEVGGQTFNRIARWDGSTWSSLGSGLDGSVLALTPFDGALIAGGSFGAAGGGPANRIARWDGSTWSPLGVGINTQVGALTIFDGALIVAGLFSEAGEMPASNIAQWDGSAWSPLGAGTSGRVSAVAPFDGALIAGGTFTEAGGIPVNRIARWDGSAWSPLAPEPLECELPTWVAVDPASGSVAGGEAQPVTVTFDAGDLAVGDYAAALCLASNDPEQPVSVVPLALTVIGENGAELTFDPADLDFGDVEVGTTSPPQTSMLQNTGGDDATGLVFSPPGGGFEADTGACGDTLAAGESCPVSVTFTPPEPEPATATLEVESVEGASAGLALAGHGVDEGTPIAEITPEAFEFEVLAGGSDTQILNVGNIGSAALEWLIEEAEAAPARVAATDLGPTVPYAYGLTGEVGFHAPVGYGRATGLASSIDRMPADPIVLPTAQLGPFGELDEGFDDITLLPGAGWALINNSEPLGPSSWFQGNPTIFESHEGDADAYIAVNFESTDGSGDISNWLLTPEVTIVNGTELRFWTRTSEQFEEYFDRLEVRLSVEGDSVDVGETSESVGDFTELLLTINENLEPDEYPEEWTEYVLTVRGRSRRPATGRFAFRYWVTDSGPLGSNGDYIGIDTVSVTQPGGGGGGCANPVDVPWLSTLPDAGTTPPDNSVPVDVTVDTTGVDEGEHEALLCVMTNDPEQPLTVVPVSLTVVSAQEPTFESQGDLPGGNFESVNNGVSADGSVVVGRSVSANAPNNTEAFRWADGEMEGLGDLEGGFFWSEAHATSADGSAVVGLGHNQVFGFEAFRWQDGEMEGLGDLEGGSFSSLAADVSSDGSVVVGIGNTAAGDEAFRWEDGEMEGLGLLPGGNSGSGAFAVSTDGSVVVGRSSSENGLNEAFRWTEDNGMEALGDLPGGGFLSWAHAVSADGSVVVGRGASGEGTEAIRWEDGEMEGLGDLPGGLFYSEARGVSGDGSLVVGFSNSENGDEAFIWTEAAGMRKLKEVLEEDYDLDLAGWTLVIASDASDDGTVIVGTGTNPDGNTEAWRASGLTGQ